VGQNPQLPAATLRENVLLARPDAREDELQSVLDRAWVSEFLPLLALIPVGDQRRAVRRSGAALLPARCLSMPVNAAG
jgi:ABC-type transport system involved in cytochrome bd biosynthesis fused ATPase/permease subunit